MKKFSTDILAVFETHAGGEAASRICRGLGFENSFRVDACGQVVVCGSYGGRK